MRTITQVLSAVALAGSLVPAGLFWAGQMDLPQVKHWLLCATVLWFLATPLWMERKNKTQG